MQFFSELFSYSFITRALIAGSLIALCSALLGIPLVLKRYSMIGDGLSHVGFGSMAIALALNASPLVIAIPVTILASFFLLKISSNTKMKGDASIAVISTSSLALGIMISSMTSGLNTDVNAYLFGSILSIDKTDVITSIILSVTVIAFFAVFYNQIFAVTFDETFSSTSGTKTNLFNALIAIFTSLTIVIGMRLMGAMMISSLIIFPALSSMRFFKSFKSVTISSVLISVVCFFAGIMMSFAFSSPAGATIVISNLIVFIGFIIAGKIRNKIAS
ncbi:MAG: metal ABC transporter permease [Treponemataceae bacterium]|nr:metal ABC transporter permease [Spirochaetales bacterium]MDY6032041.1 metal ABC transporter permease [Treponemataceae bacterium]